jgi:hypothetical protein
MVRRRADTRLRTAQALCKNNGETLILTPLSENCLARSRGNIVAQMFNLPYRLIVFGSVLDWSHALACSDATQITNLRYGAARRSRNQRAKPRMDTDQHEF